MNWVIIVAILIIVVMFFKAHEVRHKFFALLIIVLLLFFLVTFAQVALIPGVDFDSFDGVVSAGKIYFNWLGYALGNVRFITGNAVKLDWGFNITNFTK
ncbi:MAG: hypothetical protein AABW79_01120 [Nanoarchaeota archaeon]